jgi:hypothetical protein
MPLGEGNTLRTNAIRHAAWGERSDGMKRLGRAKRRDERRGFGDRRRAESEPALAGFTILEGQLMIFWTI